MPIGWACSLLLPKLTGSAAVTTRNDSSVSFAKPARSSAHPCCGETKPPMRLCGDISLLSMTSGSKACLPQQLRLSSPTHRLLNRQLNGVPSRITTYGEGCLREATFNIELRDLIRSYPRSPAEESLLERYPFRVGRDLQKRLIDRPLERAVLGERDRHIGRRKQPLRHFLGTPVTF